MSLSVTELLPLKVRLQKFGSHNHVDVPGPLHMPFHPSNNVCIACFIRRLQLLWLLMRRRIRHEMIHVLIQETLGRVMLVESVVISPQCKAISLDIIEGPFSPNHFYVVSIGPAQCLYILSTETPKS